MKKLFLLSLLFAGLSIAGCTNIPKLAAPVPPVPLAFPMMAGLSELGIPTAELGWRTMFKDPRLERIIELALANNRDLRLSTLNAEAVYSQFRIQRAPQFPSVDVSGTFSRQRSAANKKATPPLSAAMENQHEINLGFSAFEIDLFGRIRSQSKAVFARYLASEEGRRAAQISLVGAVADAYFAERLAVEQLMLTEQTLVSWNESLDLARRLKAAHQASGLDVAQAEGQVDAAVASLEARKRTLNQAHNALVLLIGDEVPADLPDVTPLNSHQVLTSLPPGLPSELLRQRPDIRTTEQNLIAANADIGVARAAFFPRITLTSMIGFASPELSGLFNDGQGVWSVAPQITQPIFQRGRLRAELRISEIRKSAAIAEYERAIQSAFREVADGLAGAATYGPQIEAQDRLVASANRRVELSNLRYNAGLDGRLELLDAQRQLYLAQAALLDLRRDQIGNSIMLYRALGGGMHAMTLTETPDTKASSKDVQSASQKNLISSDTSKLR